MWKLLRWLLLVILPILGLFAGWKLQPVQKPVWTYQAEYVVKPLGYVNNDSTLLVAEVTSQGKQSLFGLEPETGVEQFRIPITRELLDASAVQIREAALSDDERYVVFPASHYDVKKSMQTQVILFDWKAGIVEKRFWLERMVQSVFLKNNTLVVREGERVTIWKLQKSDESQHLNAEEMNVALFDMNNGIHFNLNPDASITYRTFFDNSKISVKMLLYDINERKFLPEIEGYYSDLDWSQDGRSFTAVRAEIGNPWINKLTLHYFVRSTDGFKEVSEKEVTLAASGCESRLTDKHFRIIHSIAAFDPRRMWLKQQLGTRLGQFLENYWPGEDSLILFDRNTNQLHATITGIESPLVRQSKYAFSLPEKNGLLISNREWLHFWNYNPISNWYPLFGLLAGVLLSVLLIWISRRRRTPNLSVAQLS